MDDSSFEINPEVDKVIREKYPANNWADTLFNWLTPKLRNKYYQMHDKFYNKPFLMFIQGVRYEYGVDMDKNIPKAFECYSKAAEENDPHALYKMYTIHSCESEKFRITRVKNEEMYYLYKAIAYSDSSIFFSNDTLFNIDIAYEIAYVLDLDDPSLDKTNKLFMDMESHVTNDCELRFVEAMTLIKFNVNEDDVEIGISILLDLADNSQYVEAIYKLACIYSKNSEKYVKSKDSILASKYFQILEEKKFYKGYADYGYFLYYENKVDKCKEILKSGVDNGNYRCFFIYYDLFLSTLDFSKKASVKELTEILDFLVNDIITGNIFSFFEFFYMRRILEKHFKYVDYEGAEEHQMYANELIDIINKVYNDKKYLENNFIRGLVETEFLLSFGFINYIGAQGKRNYEVAEKVLEESFKISSNPSYKRFCYSYIHKIRIRKAMNSDNENNEKVAQIAEKTKLELFKIYNESLDNGNLDDFSSSYFYYLAKLHENGWGTKQDTFTSYCFYYQASIAQNKYLGTGSIISYFRKYKAKQKLDLEKFTKIEAELGSYKQAEEKKEMDDNLCYICFENPKDVIFFPCRYMTCQKCYNQLKATNKCPHCRGKIILVK